MSNRFGFFLDQNRLSGVPNAPTIVSITGEAVNANTMVFTINSNLTTQANIKYTFEGLNSADIVEDNTGYAILDNNGNATVTINLIPSSNTAVNTAFNMNVTSVNDFPLGASPTYNIIKTNEFVATGTTVSGGPFAPVLQYTSDTGNATIYFKGNNNSFTANAVSTFNFRYENIDPWVGSGPNVAMRVIAVGGGAAGQAQFAPATLTDFLSPAGGHGGGGGGGVADTIVYTHDLTENANYTVIAGHGGYPADNSGEGANTSIFNIVATGGKLGNTTNAGNSGDVYIDSTLYAGKTGGLNVRYFYSGYKLKALSAGSGATYFSNGTNGIAPTESTVGYAGPALDGQRFTILEKAGTLSNVFIGGSGAGGAVRADGTWTPYGIPVNVSRGLASNYGGQGGRGFVRPGISAPLDQCLWDDMADEATSGTLLGAGGGGGWRGAQPNNATPATIYRTTGAPGALFISYTPPPVYRVFAPTT